MRPQQQTFQPDLDDENTLAWQDPMHSLEAQGCVLTLLGIPFYAGTLFLLYLFIVGEGFIISLGTLIYAAALWLPSMAEAGKNATLFGSCLRCARTDFLCFRQPHFAAMVLGRYCQNQLFARGWKTVSCRTGKGWQGNDHLSATAFTGKLAGDCTKIGTMVADKR